MGGRGKAKAKGEQRRKPLEHQAPRHAAEKQPYPGAFLGQQGKGSSHTADLESSEKQYSCQSAF